MCVCVCVCVCVIKIYDEVYNGHMERKEAQQGPVWLPQILTVLLCCSQTRATPSSGFPRHRDRYVHYMSNINPLDFQLCTPTVGMTLYQEPGDRTQINDLHKILLMNSLPSEQSKC